MKRKLFSRKDGTTFREDIGDIAEDVQDFLTRVPLIIRRLLPDAEEIVIALEAFSEQIKEGGDIDLIIDEVMKQIPGTTDEKVYEKAREIITAFVIKARIALEKAETLGAIKREAAVGLIQDQKAATTNEAALAIEMILFAHKNS